MSGILVFSHHQWVVGGRKNAALAFNSKLLQEAQLVIAGLVEIFFFRIFLFGVNTKLASKRYQF